MTLHSIFFSGKGTTRISANCISEEIGAEIKSTEIKEYNWLESGAAGESIRISAGDALLFSMPIYGGYIPRICAERVGCLQGEQTPAIIAAVYGNRHYDNSLLQMKELLEEQGFVVIAAGAFLAEHSIFPTVAAGRPDADDFTAMKAFAKRCGQLLSDRKLWEGGTLALPGKEDYDASAFKGVPFHPDGDERCVSCRRCAKVCPRQAIDPEKPRETKAELCISCGACIRVCPEHARDYHGLAYQAARKAFELKCAAYRKPEVFYITAS